MFKNVASQKIALYAFDATTGTPKTGDAANLTAYVSKDYGAVTALGDATATEIDATNAKGWYLWDLTQAETNADALLFTGKSSTANIVVVGQPIQTIPQSISTLDAAGVRSAVGLASANLDTQLSGVSTLTAAGVRSAIGLASANLDTQLDAIPTAIENADALLDRNMATGADNGSPTVRTVRQALRFLRNKWSISGTTLTVTKEDDTTASWTSTVTATAGADPITGNDPA